MFLKLKRRNKFISNQNGFFAVNMIGAGLTCLIVLISLIFMLSIPVFMRAYKEYGHLDSAINFAVSASNHNNTTGTADDSGNTNGLTTLNTNKVLPHFIDAYCTLTHTNYANNQFIGEDYSSPINLINFYAVNPGDPIPPEPAFPGEVQFTGSTAMQPGYVAVIEVPVWSGGWMGMPPLKITLRDYGVAQAVPLSQ